MRDARCSGYREYLQAEQRRETRFLAATRRDGALWAHFGVARPRHTTRYAFGLAPGTAPKAAPSHARKQVRQAPSAPDDAKRENRESSMSAAQGSAKPYYFIPQPSHWPITGSVALLL